jgi:hypothetical protein
MKLYATVTSERATKGQGGRNLVIDITGENGLKLWTIEVNPTGLNAKDYSLLVQRTKYNPLYCFDDRLNEKGEKQKGESVEVLNGSEYTVKNDKGEEVIFESVIPKSLSI